MKKGAFLVHVPMALTMTRALLGPLLLLGTWKHLPRTAFLVGVLIGLLSDVFDGILARRLHTVTERTSVADSWADASFSIGVALAIWHKAPDIIFAYRLPLLLVLSMQLGSYAFDLVKYGRIVSFHAYIAKIWGITLFIAVLGVAWFHSGVFLWPALIVGVLSNIEAIAMKIVLPSWRCDVRGLWHALRIRQEEKRAREILQPGAAASPAGECRNFHDQA